MELNTARSSSAKQTSGDPSTKESVVSSAGHNLRRSLAATLRPQMIEELQKEVFDLVIIGGGITGAGVARDAASRGMSVALVEARDFAEGTSSRSSKLIHGGIRYLENMEFGLVFEALSERRLLFEIAPHLVHPLRFVLPLYQGGRVGMLKMGMGMWLYDALSMFEAPEPHERLTALESVERLPLLRTQGLMGSYVYSDAYMDDDRLTIETLRAAVRVGALAVNHITATGATFEDGKVTAIQCEDRIGGRKVTVRGRHFISTVGPWTDIVANQLMPSWKKILRPSKGVHLTFARDRLKLNQAVVMAADKEKRIVFGIPRHEMCILGTTDTDFSGDPENVCATAEDVSYLLRIAEEYFPGAQLGPEDIISSYAGVRPLVDDGAASESKTSREHLIYTDPRNITFVAGGKYTTYRRMAEQTVKAALETFSLEDRVKFGRSDTKVALNPAATLAKMEDGQLRASEWARAQGWSVAATRLLVQRHGAEALELMALSQGQTGPRKIVGPTGALIDDGEAQRVWVAELRHAVRHTQCMGLIDFYVRRSPLFLATRDHGLSLLTHLSAAMADELSWSDRERQEQEAGLRQYIAKDLQWKQSFKIDPSAY